MGNFKEDIAGVKALVFDVDGVFTDGDIIPLADGDFIRKYYAKDGYAVACAIRAGYNIAIITGGYGKTLEMRFERLGVKEFYSKAEDKLPVLERFMEKHSLRPEEVLYMGDDIPDREVMERVGMPVCPADAAHEIIGVSRYVSQFPGGRGCVRDIIEQVLRVNGDWGNDLRGVTSVPSR